MYSHTTSTLGARFGLPTHLTGSRSFCVIIAHERLFRSAHITHVSCRTSLFKVLKDLQNMYSHTVCALGARFGLPTHLTGSRSFCVIIAHERLFKSAHITHVSCRTSLFKVLKDLQSMYSHTVCALGARFGLPIHLTGSRSFLVIIAHERLFKSARITHVSCRTSHFKVLKDLQNMYIAYCKRSRCSIWPSYTSDRLPQVSSARIELDGSGRLI
jgi:hypothetical protein